MSQKLSAADHSHKIQGKKLLMHIEFYKNLKKKNYIRSFLNLLSAMT